DRSVLAPSPTRRSSDLPRERLAGHADGADLEGPAPPRRRPGGRAPASVRELEADRVSAALLAVDDLYEHLTDLLEARRADVLRRDRKSTRLNSSHVKSA